MNTEEYLAYLKNKYGENSYIYKRTLSSIDMNREIKIIKDKNNTYCYIGELNLNTFANSLSELI